MSSEAPVENGALGTNKRPRLSDESSNESSGPSVETNLTLHWDPIAVAATQTASQTFPTLDTSGNPMLNLCNNGIDRLIATSPPVRNLNWRRGSRGHLTSERKRRAALGQRSAFGALMFQNGTSSGFVRTICLCNASLILLIKLQDLPLYLLILAFLPRSMKYWLLLLQLNPSSMVLCTLPNGTEPPLDDGSLAKDINGMIAVREDLREVRTRVAYDIKKLSKFTGDGGSEEEETLENDEPNPFYKSGSELGDDDTGSAHAGSENDGSEVGSLGVGSVDLDSDVVDSVVGSNDVASVVDSNDVDVGDVGDVGDVDDDDDDDE
ncbi:hypothetical protein N7453_007135 [Penicillium expansum]|nr:hypothetical protein N7453_007135 [Penicillium expansum]